MLVPFVIVAAAVLVQEPGSAGSVRAPAPDLDDRFVEIVTVPLPDGVVLEVGGLAARGDSLFVCTRRGEIWRIDDAYAAAPKFSRWAEGLQEPLGLLDRDGWLYVAQRGELSRLRDRDGTGRMDELQTVAQGWPLSGNYHEYCFGPALAPDGRLWLTLNKPFGGEPFGKAAFRGWAISIDAAAGNGGEWVGECAGLRSPCGIATAPWGEIFYTDNQGEWCPTNKLALLERGDFHGHPWGIESCKQERSKVAFPGEVRSGQRIATAASAIPAFKLPAVWIPYDELGRSAAGFVWDSEGQFAPYRGQVFCGDQYSAEVFRISLEQVQGRWQGACYPFRRGLQCGITRVLFGWDGLWCGMTNRGWGSRGQAEYGLQRLRWRGSLPFDLVEVTAVAKGFRLRFTGPVAATGALPSAFSVASWTYDLHEDYGCPPRDRQEHAVHGVGIGADGTTVDLELAAEDLGLCRVYAIDCSEVRSREAQQPWHGKSWYTRNASP